MGASGFLLLFQMLINIEKVGCFTSSDGDSIEKNEMQKIKIFITVPSPLLTLTRLGKRAYLLICVLYTYSPFFSFFN